MPHAFFHPASYDFKVSSIKKIPLAYPEIVGIGDDYCNLISFAINDFKILIHSSICLNYYRDFHNIRQRSNLSNKFNSSSIARYGIYVLLMKTLELRNTDFGELKNKKVLDFLKSKEFERRFIRRQRVNFFLFGIMPKH